MFLVDFMRKNFGQILDRLKFSFFYIQIIYFISILLNVAAIIYTLLNNSFLPDVFLFASLIVLLLGYYKLMAITDESEDKNMLALYWDIKKKINLMLWYVVPTFLILWGSLIVYNPFKFPDLLSSIMGIHFLVISIAQLCVSLSFIWGVCVIICQIERNRHELIKSGLIKSKK